VSAAEHQPRISTVCSTIARRRPSCQAPRAATSVIVVRTLVEPSRAPDGDHLVAGHERRQWSAPAVVSIDIERELDLSVVPGDVVAQHVRGSSRRQTSRHPLVKSPRWAHPAAGHEDDRHRDRRNLL
jgi:hypothetical protein